VRTLVLYNEDVPPTRRGRVSRAESARRRELLLDVALEEFLEFGFNGANLDRICKRCRISKPTIYRQIGGKEKLFLLATQRAHQEIRQGYRAVIDQGGSPEDVVDGIIKLSNENSRGPNLASLRLAIESVRDHPDVSGAMVDRIIDNCSPIAEYILGISNGTITRQEATYRSLMLLNMAVGGFVKLLGSTISEDPDWAKEARNVFLNGILPHPQASIKAQDEPL